MYIQVTECMYNRTVMYIQMTECMYKAKGMRSDLLYIQMYNKTKRRRICYTGSLSSIFHFILTDFETKQKRRQAHNNCSLSFPL